MNDIRRRYIASASDFVQGKNGDLMLGLIAKC